MSFALKMRSILLFTIASISWLNLSAQSWDVSSATVGFKIKNAGLPVNGTVGGLVANIDFDPKNPSAARIEASVNAKSIDTGIGLRNRHLQKEDYFWGEKYPKITLKSTKVVSNGANNFIGTFALTIKAVTRNVEIPFTFSETNGNGQLQGSFEINRKDYTVGGNSWTMGDNVTINLAVSLAKAVAK
ncbi:MAG: YceI family protein [Bacteroidota bacterium]